MCDWFHGGPRHVVYRRVVRPEKLPNGVHRLHLGYLDEGEDDEEVFEGKTPEEASRKLEAYLLHAHGYDVHYSNVDTLDSICAASARRFKHTEPRH